MNMLTNEELKKIYFGAYSFKETEDGYLQAYQYTDSQMEYFRKTAEFWYDRCKASTSKTLEFSTEATELSFAYRITWMGSPDTVEICENGRVTAIAYIKDMEEEGTLSFSMQPGKKNVCIYLPADSTMEIKDFEINGSVVPAQKNEKVLWLGDSITQGFGTFRSAHTYVSVANRILNYDIINQGIGGYVYDKNVLEKMEGYMPDKIIVAMGTNQFGTETMKDIEEYYERLTQLYKDIPVLCVTPLWRGDVPDGEPTLISFCDKLRKIASSYEQVTVVDGFELVPHLPEYYLDNLHPNPLGAEIYGRNLVREIERLHF